MVKYLNIIRTHPKKSILVVGALAYFYDYLAEKYRQDLLIRQYCLEIKPLGNSKHASVDQLRRLTVFLNPFARRGNLLKDFEKMVAPLLQLSGLDVKMVYTDNDDEIKDFVSVLDPSTTDGILIASDDHGLQKAVTALLQRDDYLNARVHNMPISIVPIGVWNTFGGIFGFSANTVKWCYDALTPLLAEKKKFHNVLEITRLLPTPTEDDERQQVDEPMKTMENPASVATFDVLPSDVPKKTYSLLGIEWSIWRDIELGGGCGAPKRKSQPKDTNEHRGVLDPLSITSPSTWFRHLTTGWRHCWFWLNSSTYTPTTIRSSNENASFFKVNDGSSHNFTHRVRTKPARLVYTPACDGCSKCWNSRSESLSPTPTDVRTNKPASTFSHMFGLNRPIHSVSSESLSSVPEVEDRSGVINETCGQPHTLLVDDASSVIIALEGDYIRVDIGKVPLTLSQYLHHTWIRLKSRAYSKLIDDFTGVTLRCSTVQLHPDLTQNEFYWIDNDHFEACPISVSVKRNAFTLYNQ